MKPSIISSPYLVRRWRAQQVRHSTNLPHLPLLGQTHIFISLAPTPWLGLSVSLDVWCVLSGLREHVGKVILESRAIG